MPDTYKLLILSTAAKELQSLREPNYSRIKQRILLLASNPRPRGSSKLTGREGWRIRAGDYRIIYEISDEDKSVTILHIGHRRNVYKNL